MATIIMLIFLSTLLQIMLNLIMNFYIIRRTINIARNNITSKISQKQGNKNEFETINPSLFTKFGGIILG